MRLIDAEKIKFICAFNGTCMGTGEECKKCADYVCDFEDIQRQPTIDETEIIRKPMERIIERLKNLYPINPYPNPFSNGRDYANGRAIQIVKEEGGME